MGVQHIREHKETVATILFYSLVKPRDKTWLEAKGEILPDHTTNTQYKNSVS